MDLTKMQAMLEQNPSMCDAILANAAVPAQVKEMAEKIQIVHNSKRARHKVNLKEKKEEKKRMMKKRIKLRRRKRLARHFRRLKRKAKNKARRFAKRVAWVFAFIFTLIAMYFNLLYTIMFSPAKSMAWLTSSIISILSGWFLVAPFEAFVASGKAEVVAALGEQYMESLGGDRLRAGLYKQGLALKRGKDKKKAKDEKAKKKDAK